MSVSTHLDDAKLSDKEEEEKHFDLQVALHKNQQINKICSMGIVNIKQL